MKKLSLLLYLLCFSFLIYAQNVGNRNHHSQQQRCAGNKGRQQSCTDAGNRQYYQAGHGQCPKGMMVYDTTYSAFYYHDGNKWRAFSVKNTVLKERQ